MNLPSHFGTLPSTLEDEPNKPKKPAVVAPTETYIDSAYDSSKDEVDVLSKAKCMVYQIALHL